MVCRCLEQYITSIAEKLNFYDMNCCGKCLKVCPQNCIDKGEPQPYTIRQNNCLHCGDCFENCPAGAIIRL